jgi:riboflavin kinase/FMN adenylyltransferase
LLPAHGIYATVAIVNGVQYRAVTSVGVRPTMTDGEAGGRVTPATVTIEAYLMDVSMDLYGQAMRLGFVEWLRPEEKFDTLEALSAQIARDCDAGRQVFSRAGL